MKSQVWIPFGPFGPFSIILMLALSGGCSGSDSAPTPAASSNLGGALASDTFTPASDQLNGEESGLMSAGESEPESRQQRPPG